MDSSGLITMSMREVERLTMSLQASEALLTRRMMSNLCLTASQPEIPGAIAPIERFLVSPHFTRSQGTNRPTGKWAAERAVNDIVPSRLDSHALAKRS